MYASLALGSTKIFATRPKLFASRLFGVKVGWPFAFLPVSRAFGLPYCATNLPSCVNFMMCESPGPLPPIHTMPV